MTNDASMDHSTLASFYICCLLLLGVRSLRTRLLGGTDERDGRGMTSQLVRWDILRIGTIGSREAFRHRLDP